MVKPKILCIGSVLWDIIGHTSKDMKKGYDVPGRIRMIPGGVALNIAMTLARYDVQPALLSCVGDDPAGKSLIEVLKAMGLDIEHMMISPDLMTDRYMAVEDNTGLVAAIADAHSLEKVGNAILDPLRNGALGDTNEPFKGIIALDGNLTSDLLSEINIDPCFAACDLRLAPASPGKAHRLKDIMTHPNATLYVNREEAGLILRAKFETSQIAAKELINAGCARVLVTDGAQEVCLATSSSQISKLPRQVPVKKITGAGDTFMAAHIAAEFHGKSPEMAMEFAVDTTAKYIAEI